MLDIKKIRKRRNDALKKFNPSHPNRVDQFERLVRRVNNPIDTEHRYHAWAHALSSIADMWCTDYAIYGASTGQPEIFRAGIGLVNSSFLYGTYSYRKLTEVDSTRKESRSAFYGEQLSCLVAAGHEDLAQKEADYSFSTQAIADDLHEISVRPPRGFDRYRHDWFGIFLAMTDPADAGALGYQPTPEEFGSFWVLLQKWDAKDPAEVRNALTASREFMVANATMAESKRHFLVGLGALLWDYEVRAVNQKRATKGLVPVEVETYIDTDLVGDTPIPFVRDDIFWPAHLRYCEELGIAPYEFKGDVIDIALDPSTGEIKI